MDRPKGKHYKNHIENGTAFITTTVLDFNTVFLNPMLANAMTAGLLSDCKHYGARLWAFVVIPHHLHLLLDLPPGMSVSRLMRNIKRNSSNMLVPLLSDEEKHLFDDQRGLNRSTFWMARFRSVEICTEKDFSIKVAYIHDNPVKSGLCARPEDYRWSSASIYPTIRATRDSGIIIDDQIIRRFRR
jgi:putative transposase